MKLLTHTTELLSSPSPRGDRAGLEVVDKKMSPSGDMGISSDYGVIWEPFTITVRHDRGNPSVQAMFQSVLHHSVLPPDYNDYIFRSSSVDCNCRRQATGIPQISTMLLRVTRYYEFSYVFKFI